MVFDDRAHAGALLSKHFTEYSGRDDVCVLAIPRGGVIVGAEIASRLNIRLEVVVTKKIGAPENPELAIGAVAEDGEPIFDEELVSRLNVDEVYKRSAVRKVHVRISEYIRKFRGGRELDVDGKVVIVVDDGVATGRTIEAALRWLRAKGEGLRVKNKGQRAKVLERRVKKDNAGELAHGPKQVVLAIPTGARDSMERLEKLADRTVCLDKPSWFAAVGQFYKRFDQVSDEEVLEYLRVKS